MSTCDPVGSGPSEPDAITEQTPLVSDTPGRQRHRGSSFSRDTPAGVEELQEPGPESKSTFYLILLTIGIGGLQVAWATEMSNGSPFLLSLGMSKAALALVWIAGPLSGILVQPYIGSLSDRCRLPWGKRKPFILGGAVATVVSLLALSWCKEIVGFLFRTADSTHYALIVFATLWIYILDFAINTVQASLRAFIVDCAPFHQQEDANAWASRLTGLGNILGHFFAYIDLPTAFPFLGDTQFKVLCAIAALLLTVTASISAVYVTERDPRLDGPPAGSTKSPVAFFRSCLESVRRLPPQTRKVCEVQIFNWIGWFPFLFYTSTYVGEIYVTLNGRRDMSPDELDTLWQKATRVGSFSLFVFACTSFAANMLLPVLISSAYQQGLPSHENSALSLVERILRRLQIPGLTLRRAWLLSHVLFAVCMALTVFVGTVEGGYALAGFVGISWALTLWAPFALIALDISRLAQRNRHQRRASQVAATSDGTDYLVPADEISSFEDQAGIVLGLHNVAISAPQVLSSIISSLIFKATQRDRGVAKDNSVGWVLRFGGVAALVAALMTTRIDEMVEDIKHVQKPPGLA